LNCECLVSEGTETRTYLPPGPSLGQPPPSLEDVSVLYGVPEGQREVSVSIGVVNVIVTNVVVDESVVSVDPRDGEISGVPTLIRVGSHGEAARVDRKEDSDFGVVLEVAAPGVPFGGGGSEGAGHPCDGGVSGVLHLHHGGSGLPGVSSEGAGAEEGVVVPGPLVGVGREGGHVEGHDSAPALQITLKGRPLIGTLGLVVQKEDQVNVPQLVVVHSVPVGGGLVHETVGGCHCGQESVGLPAETDVSHIPSSVVKGQNLVGSSTASRKDSGCDSAIGYEGASARLEPTGAPLVVVPRVSSTSGNASTKATATTKSRCVSG